MGQKASPIERLSVYIAKLPRRIYQADIITFRTCYEELSKKPEDIESVRILIGDLRRIANVEDKYKFNPKNRKVLLEGIDLLEEIVGAHNKN
ncbi:hypothetical protein J4204_02565 [Candidatus Woesearchaeota archaeon]|nr:hypothetical protein [Candidatus Woesearchaeota archaeon]